MNENGRQVDDNKVSLIAQHRLTHIPTGFASPYEIDASVSSVGQSCGYVDKTTTLRSDSFHYWKILRSRDRYNSALIIEELKNE
jgi:hypothetical protein